MQQHPTPHGATLTGPAADPAAPFAQHYRRPQEHPFRAEDRERVTLLLGGLTRSQDRLLQAVFEGQGYRAALLPLPTRADLQTGKEYGNNGQCNPTYFTVGSLVRYLIRLRDEEGMGTQQILRDYAFLTAGSCGPCRFGMYESEYRLALRNAGFEGFRVLIFEQSGAITQNGERGGLEITPELFLGLLNAILIGDTLNAIGYQVRPYEREPGALQRTMEACIRLCEEALRNPPQPAAPGLVAHLLARLLNLKQPQHAALLLDRLRSGYYCDTLERCRELLEQQVEVDYTRPRPLVKITGEFWAQTTEGEGNYHIFRFLEGEGAEVLVEPVATWVDYLLHDIDLKLRDRRGLPASLDGAPYPTRTLRSMLQGFRRRVAVRLAQWAFVREHERIRHAAGGTIHPLVSQHELQALGHPYYNPRATGGEGYLEVAKNIYYFHRHLAHMTLSLKPFGCMPSTQSDGAQAAVMAHYPDLIYLPVETSGEGEINAYSRVQMALGEAKSRCKEEFRAALAQSGHTLEEIRAYVAAHPELRRPLQPIPHHPATIGRAANFILHVAARMANDPARQATTPGQFVPHDA